MVAVKSKLMEKLADKAGDSTGRLYNDSLPYKDTVLGTDVISGLAQCTPDLAPSECNRCISDYIYIVSRMYKNDSSAGGIKGYSCYLRYQLGTIKITKPPEPATLAMPPPPALPPPTQPVPVRPSTSPTPGSKSCSS
jgi:hypothetical protein